MPKASRSRKKPGKTEEFQTIDDFIEAQLSEYIRIHKKHEKEINYIG